MLKKKLIIITTIGLASCGDLTEPSMVEQEKISTTASSIPIGVNENSTSQSLNLQLSSQSGGSSLAGDNYSKANVLPDLFDKEEKEKKTKIGGKLLNDRTNPDYVDSIEGAQVSVEMKLD